ncbi:threonine synthase [Salegentibacter sp. HM20]
MRYYSLNDRTHFSNFENAVIKGLAPDRGLYFPERIPKLPDDFFKKINSLSKTEIALQVIREFVGDEIPEAELTKIIERSLGFEFPVKKIEKQISVLELFHGPTLAFKDVGAAFMAGCLGYFVQKNKLGKITVLVATSGDTGGAVAHGFLGVEGIEVVILYPKGKVSEIQEKQLTTAGKNITALEVDGSFDDCQAMVKKAFLDAEITSERQLTSANSINVARWLPQMFYYFLAWQQVKNSGKKLAISVPSGNFGNICAGLMAREMGLPISHFIAANNANDVIPKYLESGEYHPKSSVQTLSNAMDIGDPSNFVRILEIFENEFNSLKSLVSSYSFSDAQTLECMKIVHQQTGYMLDPHGAVGYLGLQKFLKKNREYKGLFIETAHPVKFPETVKKAIGKYPDMPSSIKGILDKEKQAVSISDYEELKSFLKS